METGPETDSNLAEATKRIVWRLLAIGHNRFELLMVEIQEERERVQLTIFLAFGIAILCLLGGITLTAFIALAAGKYYLIALSVLAALYLGAAALLYFKLARLAREWETFPDTREQLEKDRECLEKTLT